MKQKKEVEWYNNPNMIMNLSIGILILMILISESFAVNNNVSTVNILRNLLNHNSIYLIWLTYFIPLKIKSGKKYFNYLNLFLIIIYLIFSITSILSVIRSFGITSLINLFLNIIFLIYMIHVLLKNTTVWKDLKLESSPFNEIENDSYFYTIIILSSILLMVNLISVVTFDGVVLSLIGMAHYFLIARYIYLYQIYLDMDNKNKINIFYELEKEGKKFPRLKRVAKSVTSTKINNYQVVSYIIMVVFVVIEFIFGNLFPSCSNYSSLYYDKCSTTEFNFSLTVGIWFVGFLVSVFFYGMGEIIFLLRKLNESLSKR